MKNWRRLGMKSKLSDICFYAKGKVNVSGLTDADYISTENMLPNKGGITTASSLPSTIQTQAYKKDDVLVSNIRPYFKKIWFADFDGGCSNDVLVFRAKEGTDARFLYYVLADDAFFDYSTATSKGTKMPRGDKTAIMQYEVPHFDLPIQKKIAGILADIDDKIALNSNINKNLLQQAQALYNHSFPYTVSDILPEDWRLGTVSEIIEIHDSKRIPLSGAQRNKMEKKIYPYYGAASLMDYVDEYIFDGKYLLLGEDGTVVDDAGFPILQYVWGQFWVNNHAHILTGKLGYNVESLYMLFKQTPVKSIVTGAVQPKISQANLKSIPVVIPPANLIRAFNNQVNEMFTLIRNIEEENKSLATLRDSLLPKLMSGEIDLSALGL